MAAVGGTGNIPMYKLKSYQLDAPIELPKVMYTMKPYQTSNSNSEQASTPLATLERRQERVLHQLQQLTQAVDALRGRYNIQESSSPGVSSPAASSPTAGIPLCGSTKSASVPDKGCGALDLVISADPLTPPLSLVLLCEQLAQRYATLFLVFTHSSVSDKVPPHLRALGSPPGMKRADAQLVLTLVWKAVPTGPQLMVDPTRQTPILGEANIARYLARLLNPAADGDAVAATQRDEILDLAQLQIISGNTKERAAAVRNLNSSLGKSSWLSGSGPGLSDAVVWSALHQTNMAASAPANVKKWLSQCCSHAMFSGVTTLAS